MDKKSKKIQDRARKFLSEYNSFDQDGYTDKSKVLRDEYNNAFKVENPVGGNRVNNTLYAAAVNKVAGKFAFPSYTLSGARKADGKPAPSFASSFVRDAVEQIMMRAGRSAAFHGKRGAYITKTMLGDAFVVEGSDGDFLQYDSKFPENIVFQKGALSIRGLTGGDNSDIVGIVTKLRTDSAREMFGDKFVPGDLPRSKEILSTNISRQEEEEYTEVMYYYDISDEKDPVFVPVVGASADLMTKFMLRGKDYEAVDEATRNGKPYIPVYQFVFFLSQDDYLRNYGLGQLIYKLCRLYKILQDRTYDATIRSLSDRNIISVGSREALGALTGAIEQIDLAESQGKQGIGIVNDYGGGVSVTPMQNPPNTAYLQNAIVQIENILMLHRINIRAIDTRTQTATQSVIEVETENDLIIDVNETNAESYKAMIAGALNYLIKRLKNDNTPVYTNAKVADILEDGSVVRGEDGAPVMKDIEGATYSKAAKIAKNYHWIIEVNYKTGVREPDIIKASRISELLKQGIGQKYREQIEDEVIKANNLNFLNTNDQKAAQELGGAQPRAAEAPAGGGTSPESGVADKLAGKLGISTQ